MNRADISLESEAAVNVSFCDLEGGRDGVRSEGGELDWGEGNLDADPIFCDYVEGDHRLIWGLPCINSGYPESDPDPDGLCADMGAIACWGPPVLQGRVLGSLNDEPVVGAEVLDRVWSFRLLQ